MRPQIAAAGWAGSPGAWPWTPKPGSRLSSPPNLLEKPFPVALPAQRHAAWLFVCPVWLHRHADGSAPSTSPVIQGWILTARSLMVTAGLSRASPFLLLVSLQVFQVVVQENLHREEICLH